MTREYYASHMAPRLSYRSATASISSTVGGPIQPVPEMKGQRHESSLSPMLLP